MKDCRATWITRVSGGRRSLLVLLAGLLLAAGAHAAPGDILFSDDFERASLGSDWSVTASGGDAGIGTYTANSGTRSLYTRWNPVTVTSRAIDLSAVPAADLTLWIRRGDDAFSEDPDASSSNNIPDEDLVVEFLDSGGVWRELALYYGGGTDGEIYQPTFYLPSSALHAGFRLRFRQLEGSGIDWDYWHVDDVVITERAAGNAPPASCAASLFDDNFEYGFNPDRWTVSASGEAAAGVSTHTANSDSASLNTRHDAVSVTSRTIDLSGQSNIVFKVWIRRGDDAFSEDPDTGEDLVVEYYASDNSWQTLETFAGNGTTGQIYDRSYTLPADALHAGFRLRFRQTGGSGAYWDYWHVDDVCVQPFTPPGPLAYYMMDEAGWNGTAGEVIDSSGNGNHGTAQGSATTNSASPAIPGNPGTCGYGEIPFNDTVSPQDAVDTGIDVNTIGNRGTISFWYKGNWRWAQPNRDRQLFDASTDTIGNANDKYFFLVMRDRGRLRFALEDTNDGDFWVETGRLDFAADEWVYISVTWDLPANRLEIYVNGSREESANISSNGTLGNLTTLYLGDNRGSYLVSGATERSADGSIDEVRIYSQVLTASEIAYDMNRTHPCGGIHHFRIEHDGSALTCQPEDVTIRACADAACTSLYNDIVTVDLLPTGWEGGDTKVFSGGVATFQLRHNVPETVTLGIAGSTPTATNPPVCLDTSTGLASCALTFYDSGFVYTIPTQIACATSAPITVAAVRKDDTTQQCVPAFANRTADVNFWTTYVDPATGTRQLTLNNGSTDYLLPTASPGTAVPLAFDANGEAQITVTYPDAGRLSLNSQFTGSGVESGLVMTGSADFVTKPARFVVESPDLNADCATGDATCSVFRAAGDAFNLTVRAACADGSVTPNFQHDGIGIQHNLVAPAAGSAGTIGVTSTVIAAGDNGEVTIANQSVSEVGVFTFTAQLATPWLGETVIGDAASNTSPNIGRFIPAWFDVSRVNGCDAGAFTYSGQPFAVTATAYNSAGDVTANYDGSLGFAFDTTISNAGDTTGFTNNVITAASFSGGSGTRNDVTYTFADPATAPTTLTLAAADTDGVSSSGHLEPATDIHSGRIRLANAFGSELLDLEVPARVEHYDGTAFVDFPDDVCSLMTLTLTKVDGTLNVGTGANPGDTCIRDDDGESGSNNCSDASQLPGPTDRQYTEPPVNASFNLWLKGPGQNYTGNVDVNATVDPWLRFDWRGAGAENPSARATFGIYRGDDRIIYWRERFD